MKTLAHLLILFTFALVSLPATAQETATAPKNILLEDFKSRGGQVDYLGHAYGLDGWVIINPKNGAVQYAYTNPEGATVIGMLFDPKGNMATKYQLAEYMARKDGSQAHITGAELSHSSKAEKAYADISTRSNWVQIGKKGTPYVYAFINVHCEHCQNFLKQMMPHVKSGKTSIRLIPYGTSPENALAAALLLSMDDPLPALESLLEGNKEPLSAMHADKVKVGRAGLIQVNNYFAERYVRSAPPFIIYRKLSDGELNAVAGVPKNMMMLLADLTPVEVETPKETDSKEEVKTEEKKQ